jgi:hypothetical protein
MTQLDDYELQKSADESTGPPDAASEPRSPLLWAGAAGLMAALLVGAYVWLARPAAEPPAATQPTEAFRPTENTVEPPRPALVDIPPLGESDAVVRGLIAALSSHPRVAAWLTTNGLIRNIVVVVENIAGGANPARHLRVLRPPGGLGVIEEGEGMRLDPRSYQRYDGIADAVASIDAAGAATLYASLDARLEEAYRELGHQDGFDTALQRAVASLLAVPIVEGEVPLVFRGAMNGYADPRLERLTPAQKQLLRMGPRNVRIIQAKLREIAAALGIPTTPAR